MSDESKETESPEVETEAKSAEESGEKSEEKSEETPKATSAAKAAERAAKKSIFGSVKFVLAFIATLGLGYFAGQKIQEWRRPPVELETGDRYKVDLRGDEPQIGPDDALVTIIEFSDFQCPYCARAAGPLEDAVGDFDDDVRLIFKHYPLPGHAKALPAAYAAWAAHQQGKFWEFHDRLFDAKADIGGLPDWVEELELDPEKLGTDMESAAAKEQIDDDHLAGGRVGIGGTPSFVVNGHMYSGVKTEGEWKQIIEAELEIAKTVLDDGAERGEVYAKLMENAAATRGGGERQGVGGAPSERPAQQRRPGEPDPALHYQLPVGDGRPQLGPDDALVTIVEFADFHCPYCGKVAETVKKVQSEHPDEVRIIFRQRPLAMHPKAKPAAKAALAAHRQGKFWEMHDILFSQRPGLPEQFQEAAEELGLDVEKFQADMEDPAIAEMVEQDGALASKFGSRGTPAFFINGRFLGGAQPYSAFDALVTEELEKAKKRVEGGVAPADVYMKIMSEAETEVKD